MLQQLDSFFYDDDDNLPIFEIKLYPEITEEPGPNEEELEENRDSSQEIDNFIQNEKSLNAVKKTQVDWRKFESFCNQKTDGRFNITTIPCQELDKLLCHFFKDVRKKTGEEYEPDTLSSFHRSIQRRVGELKLPFNILKDEVFCRSRQVLAAKRKNWSNKARGVDQTQPASWKTRKKKSSSSLESLVCKTRLRYSVLSGGFYQCTLALEPETKAENSVVAT